jgi:hypothetical protein
MSEEVSYSVASFNEISNTYDFLQASIRLKGI